MPAGGNPTGQRDSVIFLVVLNSSCCYHCLDSSGDWSGSVVITEQRFDHVDECFSDEDVLLGCGEDILITHLHLQEILSDRPTLVLKVLACLLF